MLRFDDEVWAVVVDPQTHPQEVRHTIASTVPDRLHKCRALLRFKPGSIQTARGSRPDLTPSPTASAPLARNFVGDGARRRRRCVFLAQCFPRATPTDDDTRRLRPEGRRPEPEGRWPQGRWLLFSIHFDTSLSPFLSLFCLIFFAVRRVACSDESLSDESRVAERRCRE